MRYMAEETKTDLEWIRHTIESLMRIKRWNEKTILNRDDST